MKHTAGPWKTAISRDLSGNRPAHIIVGADEQCTSANARLIAASPEMMSVLKMVRDLKPIDITNLGSTLLLSSQLANLKMMSDILIKKIEGES